MPIEDARGQASYARVHALIWRPKHADMTEGVAYLDWFERGLIEKELGIGNDHAYLGFLAWRDGVTKRFMVLVNAILFLFAERVLMRV